MTDAHPTNDRRVGEGFAYFRWHSVQWPYPCTCPYTTEPNFCRQLWDEFERDVHHIPALKETP